MLQPHESAERWRIGTVWPYAIRRGALLLVVTCQLCLAPAWLSPGALAAKPPGSGTTVEPAPERTSPPQAEKPTEPAPERQPGQPAGPTPETPAAPPAAGTGEPAPRQAPEPPAQAKRESATSGAEPNVVKLSVSEEPFISAAGTATSSPSRLRARPKRNGPAGAHADKGAANPGRHPGQRTGDRRGLSAHHAKVKPRPAGNLRSAPTDADLPAATAPALDFSEVPPVLFRLPPGLEGLGEDNPPGYLIPIYEEAGRRYDVPWRVLAAINLIETDYGRNLGVSSSGAVGWMQFMPETWRQWAVDPTATGNSTPTRRWTRSSPPRGICGQAEPRATCRRRSSPTTTPTGTWPRCCCARTGSNEISPLPDPRRTTRFPWTSNTCSSWGAPMTAWTSRPLPTARSSTRSRRVSSAPSRAIRAASGPTTRWSRPRPAR